MVVFDKFVIIISYLILVCLFLPSIAFAYVDPGSISIVLQVGMAFLLGGLLAFKNKISNTLRYIFHSVFRKNTEDREQKANPNKN